MNKRALTAVLLAAIVAGLSCGGGKSGPATPGGDMMNSKNDRVLVQHGDEDGLVLRLSDGAEGGERHEAVPPARATRLADRDADALLARLQPLAADARDKKEVSLRERSKPAPRTGTVVQAAFPPAHGPSGARPDDAATATEGGPLSVLRFAPEGDVPLAPHVSVTFSQPMVAVTAHGDAVKAGVPVKLTPEPPGRWRWIGTRTLLFDPAGPAVRLPQATRYTVEVPAGTASATGGVLAQAVSFTFATPAPRVVQSWPTSGPQRRDARMFVLFDQDIDPAAVLATIRVKAGGRSFGVRALSETELGADDSVQRLVDAARKSGHTRRYVAFGVTEALPADAQVQVDIGPGTPSLEGPLTTDKAQSFSFRTYGPLRIEDAQCSWGSNCPPMTPWWIRFSNPLDAETFDPAGVVIEPALPGVRIDVSGNVMSIRGQSKGRTTYRVRLPATLTDHFGQTLGSSETRTFAVGSADPTFHGPSGLVVLDPLARRRTLDVFSINFKQLKVQLYAVTPADWPAFVSFMSDPYERSSRARRSLPGRKVVDTTVTIKGETDALTETAVDLSPALDGGLGHVIAVIEPTPWPHKWQPPAVHAWVQSTAIGLDAFADDTELVAWATRLDTGAPLGDVALEIQGSASRGASDDKGTARLPLPERSPGRAAVLVAQSGKDSAILPQNLYWWSDHGGWVKKNPGESLRWYVFDDRAMYRPGETVRLKGWIRRIDNRKGGDLVELGGAREVSYTVMGPRGNELLTGTAPLNALGGFDTSFALPATPNLGHAVVNFQVRGASAAHGLEHAHGFQIQEFRRPEFEVQARASQGPHVVGGSADVTVTASYYAGGGLAGADVSWSVTSTPGTFTPPGRDDYTFGPWVPWWGIWREPSIRGETRSYAHQARTDALGRHTLHLDFVSVRPPRPTQVTAQATVMDVNRQAWAASADLLVHPGDLYVGLKNDAYFVDQGKPIVIKAIAVDHDGKAAPGTPISVRAVRLDWAFEKGQYVTKERDEQVCEVRAAADAVECTFATREGGEHRITARVADAMGRISETEITTWVSGGKQPPARDVELERVTLVPDQKEYKPGDRARVLVQSPFAPAEGLLTVRRSGIVSTQRFTMTGSSTTLEIPIVEAHVPNVHVQVDLVGSAARIGDDGQATDKLPRRPAYASGKLDLSVPPHSRVLAVSVEPRERKLAPGGATQIDVAVRDAAGKPVAGAELAVVVVDEAVLSLTSYQLADPMSVFYGRRPEGVTDHHLREHVKLARPEADAFGGAAGDMLGDMEGAAGGMPAPAESAPGGMAERSMMLKRGGAPPPPPPGAAAPIAVRKDFDALAVFAPAVATDAQGRAVVQVKVPDNLTRYRVMAVAVAGDKHFGKAESSITARMPLMVRPSPPRFLNFGDTFELPVVVQNQTDAPMTVRVAVRAANAALTEGRGRELSVPANERVEVRFPAAAEMAGTARLQVAAAAGSWADAAELALPVWTPATTEAFATYGEVDSGAIRQPVAAPSDALTQLGGLEVTTSSTQLQALTDALIYLVDYPFECTEQITSRVLAVAALRDVLGAFRAEGLAAPAEIEAGVRRDLDKLRGLQNSDGGFAFWQRGHESWPYVSIHAAHALERARHKGYDVPRDMLDRSRQYLRNIERHIPSWYPREVKHTLVAYALSVRKLGGDADTARARGLIQEAGLDKLSLEAVGWLLGVLSGDSASQRQVADIHRLLGNRVEETAAAAHFTTGYSDGAHLLLHSSRRADGIILESLIADQPRSDLIAKVVRGLLAHRKQGRWQNTQENAFVLLALDRYFATYERVTPSFVARVWLGDAFAGEHAFRGRTTESHQLEIPMKELARVGKGDLVIQKDGAGRLYYRVGMTYAPTSLRLEPADHGFAVERRYEHVDDPADVTRGPDGAWVIKAGAQVRVRVTMVAQARRYHVALVDPLPAGLEPMNPALAVTGAIPQDPGRRAGPYWWWQRTWYEHQNMRDERVEAFASLVWEGVHEYTYVARATTPGRYIVPPAKAEEMYFPETFGRSATDAVIVK